jgi:DNA mismatch repair protein MutS2
MDEKTLNTLEYHKILNRLAGYCSFEASAEKARALRPSPDLAEANRWLAETSEAVELMVKNSDLTIGGARDVRASIDLANHGAILTPQDLLDIKYTLISARNLSRTFGRIGVAYPNLANILKQMPPPLGLIDAITRAISDHGEILDSASAKLGVIRRDLRISHDRLMTKLQRMVTDPRNTPYLQEALITQRDGRYVLPLRAEFKGRMRSIVHDQSASGATLFVEPLAVVELNNQYRELQLAERDEERRILWELSQQAALHGVEILQTLETIAQIDLALARGKYAEDLRAVEPRLFAINPKGERHPGTVIHLYQARHPLLDAQSVVPIDVEFDAQTYAMIITGPNTGGKTVSLKTIGLLALMAQSGLHIPAHSGSEISIFEDIFADIGDEQSIEQSLSTFSGHVTNIIHILQSANRRCLVILDELGAGTDPTEGAALARAILTFLLNAGITTLVTTHHPELKAFAHGASGVVNASVEFDLETLRPTYHLTIGLPGRSNALAIAQRLGLPEAIIQDARSELSPDDLRAEDLLNEIHHQRDLIRKARSAADQALHEAEKARSELITRLDGIEDERQSILEKARQESQQEVADLQAEVAEARRMLMRSRQPAENLQVIEDKLEVLEEKIEAPVERVHPQIEAPVKRAIRTGDRVRLRTLGSQGVVIGLTAGEAEIQLGALRMRTPLADLELASTGAQRLEQSSVQRPPAEKKIESSTTAQPANFLPVSPGVELDLRGRRADEALDALDRYLDAAFYAGLPYVRIIHGKGTGRLREVIRQALSENSHVKSFQTGGEKEGGDGVTVAKLTV